MSSRRNFIKQLGCASLALPLLKYAATKRAHAAASSPPLRLVLFPSLNGAAPELFWPNPNNLAAMSPVLEPLQSFADQLTFIRGINIEGSSNHMAIRSMYTGAPVSDYGSPDPQVASLDQVVANELQSTAPTAKKSLHLGACPADSIEFYQLYGRSTFFFAPAPVQYDANPVTAFDKFFSGLAGGDPASEAPRDFQGDALAIATAELADLEGRLSDSPRERAKLDRQRNAIAALDRDNAPSTPLLCDSSPIASVETLRGRLQGNEAAAYRHEYFSEVMDAQIDLMARALVCGMTRVATLQAGSADGNVIVPVGPGYPHHDTSHGSQVVFGQCQRWYAQKFARLLQLLDVPDPLDPGNTVLHNSCILWMSECLPSHASDGVPAFYAGSAGGLLKTGQFLEVPGASHKTLLKVLSTTMGASDSASQHFGASSLTEVLA